MTITIPDWLFDRSFWAGFGTATLILIGLLIFATRNFNPWGR